MLLPSLFSVAQGKHEEAGPLCQRAVDILENAFGPDDLELASTLTNQGDVLREQVRIHALLGVSVDSVRSCCCVGHVARAIDHNADCHPAKSMCRQRSELRLPQVGDICRCGELAVRGSSSAT